MPTLSHIIVAISAAYIASTPAGAAEVSTSSVMQGVFAPMAEVLGASFDDESFTGVANRPKVAEALQRLTVHVANLEAHAKTQDRAFEFVAKSLGRDARRLNLLYGKGRFDEARFTLHNMTDNCIACHSNLPESRKFPAADAFFAKIDAKHLDPLERARLQIVGRRFDDALASFEALIRSKDADPALATTLGSFTDYLRVAIAVKGDLKRPQALLAELAAKPGTPIHITQQLQRWLTTLKALDARGALNETSVAAAKKIMDEGHESMQFLRDRDGLVYYLASEAILSRFVRGHADRGRDVAEAYYLLGVTSSMTDHSFWITRSDFFLESAIRLAPAAAFAPRAFAMLEESLIVGFSGSGGTHMPPDVVDLLDELRRLIKQEQGKI